MKTLCVFWGMGVFVWMEQYSNTSPARRAGGAPRDQAMRCDPIVSLVQQTKTRRQLLSRGLKLVRRLLMRLGTELFACVSLVTE